MSLSRRGFVVGASGLSLASLCFRPGFAAEQRLRIVAQVGIRALDPTSGAGFAYSRLGIAETLVTVADNGDALPGLAVGWEALDPLTWRFALREGVRFHDGSPFTSSSVVSSLERVADKAQGLKVGKVTAITADGPHGVIIRTAEPMAVLPAFLSEAGSVVLSETGRAADGALAEVYGTGPFAVTDISPERIAADRFDDYWGTPAKMAGLDFEVVANPEARTNLVLAGGADIVFNLAPQAAGGASPRRTSSMSSACRSRAPSTSS